MFHPDSTPGDNRKGCKPIITAMQHHFCNESENPLDRTSIFIKQLRLKNQGNKRPCKKKKKCYQFDFLTSPLHQKRLISLLKDTIYILTSDIPEAEPMKMENTTLSK